jgi:hypothetical protein
VEVFRNSAVGVTWPTCAQHVSPVSLTDLQTDSPTDFNNLNDPDDGITPDQANGCVTIDSQKDFQILPWRSFDTVSERLKPQSLQCILWSRRDSDFIGLASELFRGQHVSSKFIAIQAIVQCPTRFLSPFSPPGTLFVNTRNAYVLKTAFLTALALLTLMPDVSSAQGLAPSKLSGIVIDDTQAELVGEWKSSASIGPYLGESYIHDMATGKGEKSVKFTFRAKVPGEHHLLVSYSTTGNRATKVPITVTSGDQKATAFLNQRKRPELATGFTSVGAFVLAADSDTTVLIETTGTTEYVIVDGIRILTDSELKTARTAETSIPKGIATVKPAPTKKPDSKKKPTPPPVAPTFARQPATKPFAKLTSPEFDRLLGITESSELKLVDDVRFFRRVSLDLVGRQPTLNEYRAFVKDTSATRREQTVERLLASADLGRNWGNYWSDVIGMRQPEPQLTFLNYQPFRGWLAEQFNKGAGWDESVFRMVTAIGKVGDGAEGSFVGFHQGAGNRIAGEMSRVFMGVRIACAECHDHPFVDMPQETFHGMAAFFARVSVKLESSDSNLINISSTGKGEHKMPGAKEMIKPTVYRGEALDLGLPDLARREQLAYWLVNRDNPFFARAFVNHIQARLMGRGFFDPVDDLGDSTQPLLADAHEALASHFAASDFDARAVFRVLVNTRAYQAVERARPKSPQDTDDATKPPNKDMQLAAFTGARPKKLRGDEVFESLVTAVSLPNVKGKIGKKTEATRFPPPPKSTRDLVNEAFKYDPVFRDALINRTMNQAMFLINNDQILKQVDATAGSETVLARLLSKESNNKVVADVLYARVLAREPTSRERDIVLKHVETLNNRERAFEDVLWSLLNSAEFTTRN